ncbi:translation initiation factor IF-2 [Ileibacterium valens]|uniref:Translation initiation factor IF-2 n=2 Tax=Ileibacterium valens TaxID=1862668 RepID=A0A1U7NDQ9_9FIRM|nr:translation initiation factor IF-2 [Ileibacterium valens]OLU37481.1 translation initiation factor IF-2 [Ileibacterium valens]OLU39271.1 translation initiation factor IF-2 [Erysipelotrichaceae bacterium NYU-BL-E8]OLU42308.1 translation initiation factor IF-2 [Erysipelotrichaceae bacterium NYU-BL-F16]
MANKPQRRKNTNTNNRNKNNNKNNNNRNNNRGRNNGRGNNYAPRPKVEYPKEITYSTQLSVGQLAELMKRNSSEIIKFLFMLGNMSTINTTLSDEDIELICMNFNVTPHKEIIIDEDDIEEQISNRVFDEKDLVSRPPVVTIMGHVDHGKTTLLDTIRNSHVTSGEFGGITQHIGAYQVSVSGKKVTFLDTPGHEAFTAMRARGAQITDIVVLIVAADDGVMPQTKESIDHARAAGVPIVVAVNKIDKAGANPERVMSELANEGVMPEEWGGDNIFVEISARNGQGVDDLLESILLVAEMQELKANPKTLASGTVVEAKLDKGRGPVATLLIQQGTLKAADSLVVGSAYGRIRKMTNDRGQELKTAGPSMPVEIIGLNEVPQAGDVFMVYDSYKKAAEIAQSRENKKIERERNATSARSLEDMARMISEGDVKEINVLIKADVQGSAEALKASVEKLDVDTVKVNVIRSTVGTITESDIMLASASNAIIYGFNIRPTAAIRKKAEEEGVEIRLHNIIYKALEELEGAMKGLLAPVYEEVITGQAEVRQIYKVSKVGTIAGCYVTDGMIKRDSGVRLIRDGIVVYTGKLGSLRRFENDVKEVNQGFECGMTIENFNDIKVGDVIEAFEDQEVKNDD